MRGSRVATAAAALLFAFGAQAQTTTGRLSGTVVDGESAPLPGATVTVESPNLIGGPRSTVTDADGSFAFPILDPGLYTVRVELSGFGTQERSEVRVGLDRTTELDVTMPISRFGEEVTVVAESPVVDPQQTSTSQNFTVEYLENAVVGSANRGYQQVLSQAAGVAVVEGSSDNPNVFGSTYGENAYYIDGLDTTDPVTATFGSNFNFDAIQEISFQTAGFEAEYGRATGGVVNLITKSGGNDFSGTVDIRYRSTSFYEDGEHFNSDENPVKFLNPSATLGGPVLRDRIWFFLSGEHIDSRATPNDSPTTRKFEGQNYIGKLTWQFNPSWRLTGKFSGNPADIDNDDADFSVLEGATTFQEQSGDLIQAELSGIFGPTLLWNLQAGINRSELNAFPQSGDFDTIGHSNFEGQSYINATNAQYSDRDRDDFKTNLTWFVDQFAGSHEIKGGVEYSDLFFSSRNFTPAGGLSFLDAGTPDDPLAAYMFESTDPGVIENDGTLQSAFLQDAWQVLPNLTLKLGARWDQVSYDNDQGVEIADMDKVQPRLGLAWDITGDARTVMRASWGRFMHPNALTLPNFARTGLSTQSIWQSCGTIFGAASAAECQAIGAAEGWDWRDDPEGFDQAGWLLDPGFIFGSAPNQISPNLQPTFAEEIVVGFERELWDRTSVEVSYIDKETEDIFEDTCNGNFPTPSADADCSFYLQANLPGLVRDYKGYLVRFESRLTDRLHMLVSYAYSKSRGNIEYTQNAGVDFDIFPDHFDNTYGYLSDDRRHRVKLNGFVLLPLDFTLGFDAFWSSDFAYDEEEISGYVGFPDIFVSPRGSFRGNSNYQLDMQIAKGFRLAGLNLQLIGTVYNVLDDERATGVCEISSGCGERVDGSAILHGDATDWQNPRRYEAGFRVTF